MSSTVYEVCPDCLSPDVHAQVWVNINSEALGDGTGRYCWCASCEDQGGDGEFKYTETLASTVDLAHLVVLHSLMSFQGTKP